MLSQARYRKKKKKVPKQGTGQAYFLHNDSRQLYNPMAGQAAVPFSTLLFFFFNFETHIAF